MKPFSIKNFITKLCAVGERQAARELLGFTALEQILREREINFLSHPFTAVVPVDAGSTLTVDGKRLPCAPVCFRPGIIPSTAPILNPHAAKPKQLLQPHFQCSPNCPVPSQAENRPGPVLAVSPTVAAKIRTGKNVTAIVKIKKVSYQSKNILIGNTKNPKHLVFCHMDSVGGVGACDNASGVAVCLSAVIENPTLLTTTLFVFAGCEERSYSKPVHWGHGYRVFQKRNKKIIETARTVTVVDSVGIGKSVAYKDKNLLNLAFPVMLPKNTRVTGIFGSYKKLMPVYHSAADTPEKLSFTEITRAVEILTRIIKK